jgi:acyl-coenzyme A synthetase/AMP-(fatty) acid ligase
MTDYEKEYASFTWKVPERFNFARDVVDRWAEDPEKLAMWCVTDNGGELKRTFLDISRASRKLANVLSRAGIKRGEVVIVILNRNPAWWEIMTACIRMGAIIIPGTTQLTAKDLEYRINAAEAACFITDTANAPKLEQVLGRCPTLKARVIVGDPRQGWITYDEALRDAPETFETADTRSDEGAIVYFTSGTTGHPKMTLHTHTSYPLGHQTTGKYWLDLTPDDLHWNISDTGWAKAAWSSYFGPWSCGAAVFVHTADRIDPATTLSCLQQYPITTMCGAPTLYRMLVLQDLGGCSFPSLRHCVGAGEPLNAEIIDTWKEATGITIRDGYGQTETVCLCASFACIEPRFGSMGKRTPGFDLQVIDEEGNVLPPNVEGDIAVRVTPERPLGLFKEYWKDPEKTAASHRGEWYLTGDRAYVDEDGYFWFVGRADDVILTSGYRIGPFEVESALIEHPAVAESAVVSSPDSMRGEVVKAFVVLAPGFTGSDELVTELQEHVKGATAPYKYPRKIQFVTELPKTVSGKIKRVELRDAEWGRKKPQAAT